MSFGKAIGGFIVGLLIIPFIIGLIGAGIILGIALLGMGAETAILLAMVGEWGLIVLMMVIMFKTDHKAVGTGLIIRIILDVVMLIVGFVLPIPYL